MTNRYVDCSERGLDIFYKVLGRYILLKISERFIKEYILLKSMVDIQEIETPEPGKKVRLEILDSPGDLDENL